MKIMSVVFLVATLFASLMGVLTDSLNWWMGTMVLLVGLLGLLAFIVLMPRLYRPPENHQAAIYRLNRFHRIVDSNQWDLVLSPLEKVERIIDLAPRTCPLVLKDIFSRDRIPFDAEIKVFYRVDLHKTQLDFIPSAMRMPSEAFGAIIATNLESLARNQVFIGRDFEELFSAPGLSSSRQELSRLLAERVEHFGLLVNNRFGVSIQNLKPNAAYSDACQENSAAVTRGQETATSLQALREALTGLGENELMNLILLQAASHSNESQPFSVILQPETTSRRPPRDGNGNGRKPAPSPYQVPVRQPPFRPTHNPGD